ncbi:phosphate galactose phosphotransferase/exopolysaccharide biosynthesis polyprenylglycosyl phosphotransferase [Haloferula helveola]|uniref:Phosphate galactose phosphotransferase/exopolysaccharide biosynthesis polyprenylglycosyl phosphotransferase n=1 Tax=Haloferula helveola TaxID=490095 RepID=A0ABM7R817_9BACT|nr:phosphate galactose phosphotransferase/exopolysaccharide biosynthesis polyprenylglycosyl phosphotransferase [Haloferula helveola]
MAHQKLVALSFLGDAAVVMMALLTAYLLRFETGLAQVGVTNASMELRSYLGHVLLGSVSLMFFLANFRLHDPRYFLAIRRTLRSIFKACAIWLAAFLSVTLLLKIDPPISRVYCLLAAGGAMFGLGLWRWLLYCLMRREPIASALRQKVVFIGWNSECERTVARFSQGRAHRYSVAGVILPEGLGTEDSMPPNEVPVLGEFSEVREIIRESGADIVMAVDSSLSRESMLELAETCGKEFIDFKLVPSCFQILVSGLQFESIHGMPVLGIGRLPLHHTFNNITKRLVDICGAIFGLLVAAPIMAVFATLVYLESPGSVIYRQRRIGLNGRPFDILKIRSMKPDAEVAGTPGWTVQDDPRRLKVGAFMRAWNIDELPQFWNVLRGEMSLVGPRPERPELIEGFKEEIRHYNVRHNVKPGLTGWAQVHGLRGDTCLKERVKFDLDYIENWNFFLDFQIMVMTLIKRKGAC